MNQLPPELFSQRPVRSEWARAPSYRMRRIITVTVCVLLITGILYRAFSWTSPKPGEIPTIKAETGTWKQRPEQPGGIDIPHQDVQVYQELDGKDAAKPGIEHLLPPPEVPQAATAPAPVVSNLPPPVAAEPLMPPKIETTVTNVTPAAPMPVPAPVASAPVETRPAPQPAPQAAPVTAPVDSAVVPKPVPAAKAKPAATAQPQKTVSGKSGHAVQLASVQGEDAAKAIMQKLQIHYASTLGDVQLHLVRADLGAKGIYYRIRSETLPDNQAREICAALAKAKAGCILVH